MVGLLLCLSAVAAASDEIEILVEADRLSDIDVAPSHLVYEKAEIDKIPSRNLGNFLQQLPGLQVSSDRASTVSIRGLPSSSLLVFWNGIKLNDPLNPTTAFDFSRLSLGGIEKIEVIRGPEASIWGSGASGAVVLLTSEAPREDGVSGDLAATLGSYESLGISGKLQKKKESFHVLSFVEVNSTRGFSAASSKLGNSERDGQKDIKAFLQVGYALSPEWKLSGFLRGAAAHFDSDARGGVGGDDPDSKEKQFDWSAAVQATYQPTDNSFKNVIDLSSQMDSREHKNLTAYDRYRSRLLRLQDTLRVSLGDAQNLEAALEYQEEQGKSIETIDELKAEARSLAARVLYDARFKAFQFRTGARLQKDFSKQGEWPWAFFIRPGYQIPSTGTLLTLSAGRSFKSPSLYQLHSLYGNPNLKPESVDSYEVSWLQDLRFNNSQLEVTYFHNQSKNFIDFDLLKNKYKNVSGQRNYGIESAMQIEWNSKFNSRLDYTWTQSESYRVARHKAGASLSWNINTKLKWNNRLSYVGSRKDVDAVSFADKEKAAYLLLGTELKYRISPDFEAHLRVDNLLDKDYEIADGYGTPGRYGEVGIKAFF